MVMTDDTGCLQMGTVFRAQIASRTVHRISRRDGCRVQDTDQIVPSVSGQNAPE
jgi:hypothetical protein